MSTPTNLETLISTLGALVTACQGYVTSWITTIFTSGNELLVASVVLPMIGIGISLIGRLMAWARRL